MYQDIIDYLYNIYQSKGFLDENTLLDTLMSSNISLAQIEHICDVLLSKGIVLSNKQITTDFAEDRSRTNYDEIFEEVVSIEYAQKAFIAKIQKIIPPQKNELKTLIVQAKNGNQYAKTRIIEMHLRIAIRQALWHHKKFDFNLSEAIQLACLGTCIGYEEFEMGKTVSYSNHLSFWIRNLLTREMSCGNKLIYFPVHIREKVMKVYEMSKIHFCEKCLTEEICYELISEVSQEIECTQSEASTLLKHTMEFDRIDIEENYEMELLLPYSSSEKEVIFNENQYGDNLENEYSMFEDIYHNELKLIVESELDSRALTTQI